MASKAKRSGALPPKLNGGPKGFNYRKSSRPTLPLSNRELRYRASGTWSSCTALPE